MKNFKVFLILAFLLGVLFSCQKDTLEQTKLNTPPQISDEIQQDPSWDEETKLFFDLDNAVELLGEEQSTMNRGNQAPIVLSKTLNKLIKDDVDYKIVKKLLKKIGHPLWKHAIVEKTVDGSKHIMYVPFVLKNKKKTTAFLVANLDLENPDEVDLNFRLTYTLDQIMAGELPITRNTAIDIIKFNTFNKNIFDKEYHEYDDLYCEACIEGNITSETNSVTTRSCEEGEMTLCYFPTEWEYFSTGSGGGGSGESSWQAVGNPSNSFSTGSVVVYGGPDANTSESEFGDFWDAVTDFFSDLANSISNALEDLWDSIFHPVICPSFEANDDASVRTTEYVCMQYFVTLCQYGSYWEIVESVPDYTHGNNVTEEEYYEELCEVATNEVFITLGIPKKHRTSALIADVSTCCIDGVIDESCAMEKYITALNESVETLVKGSGNGSPPLMLPTCEDIFNYTSTSNAYYCQVEHINLGFWDESNFLNEIFFCIDRLCIQIPKQNSIDQHWTKEEARGISKTAFDLAREEVFYEVKNGTITTDALALVKFKQHFMERLQQEMILSTTTYLSINSSPCNNGGGISSYKVSFAGICLPAVAVCEWEND